MYRKVVTMKNSPKRSPLISLNGEIINKITHNLELLHASENVPFVYILYAAYSDTSI